MLSVTTVRRLLSPRGAAKTGRAARSGNRPAAGACNGTKRRARIRARSWKVAAHQSTRNPRAARRRSGGGSKRARRYNVLVIRQEMESISTRIVIKRSPPGVYILGYL